jgi:hypothetical protein
MHFSVLLLSHLLLQSCQLTVLLLCCQRYKPKCLIYLTSKTSVHSWLQVQRHPPH